ncbi:GDP-mannose 4,6-dehydratase [Opitutales bacterium]|jgi:dTDP-glucose 4,6-dehydratase|nr:GDP-mannose 4,6-dehydratase [Opitutales bacterium]
MSKFAVIGSNSFSGSSFIKYLLKNGHEVVGISRSVELDPVFLGYKREKLENFSFYQLDLNKNLSEVSSVLGDYRPDYIVNFAAQGMVAQSWEHPGDWFQTNTVATIKLHDELRKFDWLRKYIHISTPEVYGSCEGHVLESQPFNPSTPYAVSRAAADMSLLSFIKSYNFPVVFTRAANVYGEHQQLYRIIPRAILFFLTNKTLKLHGGGTSIRSFIHIDDVCKGTELAAIRGKTGDVYHFATTQNISIRSLVKLIAQELLVDFESNVEIIGERLGKDAAYLLDCSLAQRNLFWQPEISLQEGLERTKNWIRDNIENLSEQEQDYIHKP